MPTYEYRCLDCQHQYEKREGFDAPALQECPSCGGTSRRVLHAPPVVFKGSGFYVTDSRKAAAGTERSAPEAEAAASTGRSSAEKASEAEKPAKADKAAKSESATETAAAS
jgi:putative FmdB family regulatory protein